jgi:hypothetical protein
MITEHYEMFRRVRGIEVQVLRKCTFLKMLQIIQGVGAVLAELVFTDKNIW